MSGLFEDKQYNGMDWLAKAVEPIICSSNEALSLLPNEFIFDKDDIMTMMFRHAWGANIDVDAAYKEMLNRPSVKEKLPKKLQNIDHSDCYGLKMEGRLVFHGGSLPRLEGDGVLILYKKKFMFEEEELKKYIADVIPNMILRINCRADGAGDRINEILELIEGSEEARSARSPQKKLAGLHALIKNIFTENKWNIRNVDLANSIIYWMRLFIEGGNLAAMANICKFKVMTHDGSPIYSIQEEEV